MKVRELHRWDISREEALEIQRKLAKHLIFQPDFDIKDVKLVAGIDVAFLADKSIASIVVMSFPELEVVEKEIAVVKTNFPYIPGLLAFREAPPIIECAKRIKSEPDVLLIDGQGIAHPRRFGIACHIGILLDKPSIGCAKSWLLGERQGYPPLPPIPKEKGAIVPLSDGKDIVAVALRSAPGKPPIFISCGHKIDLETAIEIVRKTIKDGQRLPAPLLSAHNLATASKKGGQGTLFI
ncbi:endonuclease V [bacterium]|nr:endonuclease V [bacterium]